MLTYKLSLIIFSAFLLFLSSCKDEKEQERLSRAQREELRIKDSLAFKVAVLPTIDCNAVLKADSASLFDSLGVDVHLRRYKALSECRIALRSGMVECAYIDSTLASILETEDKTEIVRCMPTTQKLYLVASKKARVKTTDQLTDKIIACDSHGETKRYAQMIADSLKLKKHTVFIVQCEDVTVRTQMVITGNVDAAVLPEPFATEARRKGCNMLRDYSSKSRGVMVVRKKAYDDPRIKNQYETFVKALESKK